METWDYSNGSWGNDWNQTLVTKINQMTGMRPAKIYAPIKFKPLFETLEYYDKKTEVITGKYSVYYVNNINDDYVIVDGNILEITNYK